MRNRAPTTPAPALTAHAIDPNGVYLADTFQSIFRLRKSTIRREWKAGRLRVAKRAGRYYLLGEWILEWLKAGEIRPGPKCSAAISDAPGH